jgi:hypothetical protein
LSSFEKNITCGMIDLMKKNNNDTQKLIGIIAAIIIIPIVLVNVFSRMPGKYDNLAQCITNSGTKFYGAFWCSHCQAQKRAFGKSAKLLPYIECSTPNGKDRLQQCVDAGIKGYPTWIYPDGTTQSGEVPLAVLAEKTSCIDTLR